jgi:uncharacterized protein with HEPN domain
VTRGRERQRVALGVEHLENAIAYARRGRAKFFAPDNPDNQRLVEGELRKAYESLNRLGDQFYHTNPSLPREEIAKIRQLLTHDYDEADAADLWKIATVDAPRLLRKLLRVKTPPDGE